MMKLIALFLVAIFLHEGLHAQDTLTLGNLLYRRYKEHAITLINPPQYAPKEYFEYRQSDAIDIAKGYIETLKMSMAACAAQNKRFKNYRNCIYQLIK